ncbi:hypothetical protein ANO14919_063390 [Xylariales sp. No.14919]|nr:hypothetical protein ANO14919_063390 [Xylariales sp. No.14919]
MANALDCPEDANSTDCLLRVLLQKIDDHFEEYNWDPVTFGFTVPIGFLAAIFAAFTIYQAIRTTARGLRKSNKRAIGEWSCKTTKTWDWHELSLISTVQTPILTTSKVGEALNPWPFHRQEPQKMGSHDPPVASWLRFLGELKLRYSDLPEIPLKEITADYLPDDLLAAPSYGEVGFIVAAAAAAGAHSWKVDKQWGYPTVVGRRFQFEFRPHQTLGVVGAFVQWDNSAGDRRRLTGGQLKIALLQARGDLDVGVFPSNSFTGGEGDFERLNFLVDSGKGLILRLRSEASNHRCEYGLCTCWELFNARKDQHHLLWFFMASTPPRPPYIFPSKLVKKSIAFKFLAFHSKFWASLKTKELFSSIKLGLDPPKFSAGERWYTSGLPSTIRKENLDGILEFLDEQAGEITDGAERQLKLFSLSSDEFKHRGRICVFGVVLGPSINFLYNTREFKNWFSGLEELSQEYFRVLILLQLIQINWWLTTRDPGELMCAIVSLSTTTLALLDGKPHFGEDEDGPNSRPEDDISFPHMKMLQTLGHLLSQFGLYEQGKGYKAKDDGTANESREGIALIFRKIRRHSVPLSQLTHLAPYYDIFSYYFSEVETLLRVLAKVLEGRRTSLRSNKALTKAKQQQQEEKYKPQRQEQKPHREEQESQEEGQKLEREEQKAGREERKSQEEEQKPQGEKQESQGEEQKLEREEQEPHKSDEDTIRDLLIWRCILMGMLFSTAPDNSTLLSSRVWERVVPII